MAATAHGESDLKKKALQEVAKATDPIEKIKWQCLSRGAKGIQELGRVFRNFDDSGDQSLSIEEFSKGIKDIGLRLPRQDVEAAFKKIDRDKSGTIDYNEFLIKVRGNTLNKGRMKLVEKAFNKLDKNKNGLIEIDDLKDVYDVSQDERYKRGEKSEDEILLEFLNKFDSPGNEDGTVTKEEFISYYTGISASIDLDSYFDLMMRRAWKLDETAPTRRPPRSEGEFLDLPSYGGGHHPTDCKKKGLGTLKPRTRPKGHILSTEIG